MNWTRIVIGGLLAELLVFALVIPVYLGFGQEAETTYAVAPASFIGPLVLATWWLPKRASTNLALQGTMLGFVAFLAYMALIGAMSLASGTSEPQPAIYWISHVLKVIGGGVGGYVASVRVRRQIDSLIAAAYDDDSRAPSRR